MKPMLRALFAVVVTLGLSACLEMKSTVTVNKDGTGTIEETALLGAQIRQMLEGLGAQAGAGAGAAGGQENPAAVIKGMVPDKAQAEQRAKELGEGVTVKSFEEVTSPDGKSGAKVVYAVADFNKVKFIPFTGKDKDAVPMTFAIAGDTLTLTNPPPKDKKPNVEVPEVPAELQAQLPMFKPMFAGMRMSVDVKVGSGIASSDATHQDGDTLTYADMQIDKFIDKPDIFGKFVASTEQKLSMAEAAELFKGVDGIKIEGKEVVTVKMK
jgi:hypothetical protein